MVVHPATCGWEENLFDALYYLLTLVELLPLCTLHKLILSFSDDHIAIIIFSHMTDFALWNFQ